MDHNRVLPRTISSTLAVLLTGILLAPGVMADNKPETEEKASDTIPLCTSNVPDAPIDSETDLSVFDACADNLIEIEEEAMVSSFLLASDTSTNPMCPVADYVASDTVSDVLTDPMYPWTVQPDGSLRSGNAGVGNTLSILRVTVTGSGALTYQYKVSSPDMDASGKPNTETNPDSLLIWQTTGTNGQDFLTAIGSSFSPKSYSLDRFYGEIDWTPAALPTDAGENETTEYYFVYKKNKIGSSRSDCAWLKDLRFSTGKVSFELLSSDDACGSVSGATEYYAGEWASVTALPMDGCEFYGWNLNGRLVSKETVYSFAVGENMTLTAIFGRKDAVATQNTATGFVYYSVGDALANAAAGETVILLADAAVDENITVPSGVTLYIPYSNDSNPDGCTDGTVQNRSNLATEQDAFLRLTVAKDASVEIFGTLRLGGVIGFPAQNYQGHTSGAHGRITNHGTLTVKDGGVLDTYGFIDGDGSVVAVSGAKVYEPFIVYDYSGGNNTLALHTAGQSPFGQYTMQNIRCMLGIQSGALLIGRCNLYASGQFNKTNAVIVGDPGTKGIVSLKNGAVLKRTVDFGKTCSGYCSDLGRVLYSFSGGADFNFLAMQVLGVNVSTENVLFPIPFGYEYILASGIYDINTDLVLMPGASMTVETGTELNVHDRFYVLDGLKQNALSGKSYPSTALLQTSGFAACGELIVNGTLSVDADVPFGGIVQTGSVGAGIITAKNKTEKDPFTNSVALGAEAAFGDNTTVLPLEARVRIGDALVKLNAGDCYYSVETTAWTLTSYSVTSYTSGASLESIVTHGAEQITIEQTMKGSFSLDDGRPKLGDVNQDGKIDAKDTTRLAKSLAGSVTLTDSERSAADVNGDGKIDAKDTTRLAKYLAGSVPSL